MFTYERIIDILSLIISFTSLAPIDDNFLPSVQNYLTKYGYLDRNDWNITDTFINALKTFQRFAALNITGEIDHKTLAMMYLPRCGEPDFNNIRRQKRFALIGGKWNRNQTVTYKVRNHPNNLTEDELDHEIKKAAKLWSDVSTLKFSQKKEGPANIEILFEKIDGPGYNYGFCNGPSKLVTLLILDIDEPWTTIQQSRGVNIFRVIAHLLGHAIGLQHSEYPEAVMKPFVGSSYSDVYLHQDDINGAEFLYGKIYRK